MSKDIEKAIKLEDWKVARTLIKNELKQDPKNHWLLTRLGLTYYEQRQYKKAFAYSTKALILAPKCPLVLWDYAGCLEMLECEKEAIAVYLRIVKKGVRRIANDKCGEGLSWAMSLIADCHYRLANCYRALGQLKVAIYHYKRHLYLRAEGVRSIYHIRNVRNQLRIVER